MRVLYGLDSDGNIEASARFDGRWWEIRERAKANRLAFNFTYHARLHSAAAHLRAMGASRLKLERT